MIIMGDNFLHFRVRIMLFREVKEHAQGMKDTEKISGST